MLRLVGPRLGISRATLGGFFSIALLVRTVLTSTLRSIALLVRTALNFTYLILFITLSHHEDLHYRPRRHRLPHVNCID